MRDGSAKIPPAPFGYTVFKWRREMRVSPAEAAVTDPSVIVRDMEYVKYEQKYGPKQEQK